jgi:2-polyprenyl-3-methyl-5-hydroxy-6-metoxy-1,4-benzoquinol methylase
MHESENACLVCGSKKWTAVYKISEWSIEECAVCGLARINPLPSQQSRPEFYSQEKVTARNTKALTGSQRFSRVGKRFFKKLTQRDKYAIFYHKLCRYLPSGAKILDIGCGDGSFLRQARTRFDCYGIEISEYLANLAKRDSLKVRVGNFIETDFTGEKYEGITLISLLEHLNDPRACLKKCFNLLGEGAVLLIKTVNYGCLNRVIKGGKWSSFRPPDHVFYFTPANLKRLLAKIGFSKIRTYAWVFNDNMYCDARK